ncbi:MAG TPA: hypothetical protein VHV75_11395 [Solirubrobacteraceae bacterium]|jgi:hypothetical protein|nr:hypothetical protein [Solirubrobacteraceae bacterium]
MAIQTPTGPSTEHHDIDDDVIEDARRRQRRHRNLGVLLLAAVIAAGAAVYLVASGAPGASRRAAPPHGSGAPSSPASAHASTPTRSPDLIQPTTLATLPDGNLLILESSRDQILELKPDGALSVFAGNGRVGFAGDGGPAQDAELDFTYFSSPGMTVTPNGNVDVLDDGNCRIRQINPDGVIQTILRVPLVKVYPHGAACRITSVAVSPAGSVYIATDSEIERLSANGHLVRVAGRTGSEAHEPAHLTPSDVVFSPVSIALNHAGDLYIASFSPKAVYQLTPAGKLTVLGGSYPTELTPDPDGSVLVGTHFGVIQEATSSGIRPYYSVNPKHVTGIDWGSDGGFQENGIAVTRAATIYVDNAQGNGYGAGTVLVRISPDKHAALVPIRTSLAATMPRVGAPGFPVWLYPAARPSRGAKLASCPSDEGLERFTPRATAQARRIARTYLSSQFASDIAVTDRSWWIGDFNDYTGGDDLGRHTVTGEAPTSKSPIATSLTRACGLELVEDSITVTVGKSGYSDFAGTLYVLDRDGHPLVYDVR